MAKILTPTTIIGNVVAKPELRHNPANNSDVVSFRVASTPSVYNAATKEWEDGEPLFLNVYAWSGAKNAADSLNKGTRVIVTGELRQRSYTNRDGEERVSIELRATEIAVSTLFGPVYQDGAQPQQQGAPAQFGGQPQAQAQAQQPQQAQAQQPQQAQAQQQSAPAFGDPQPAPNTATWGNPAPTGTEQAPF